jgi:hypothetical protein
VTIVLALAAGYVAAVLLLATTTAVLGHPVLERENYRGHRLPTAAGFLLVAAVVAVEGGRTLLSVVGLGDVATAPDRVLILAAVVMFGFLGVVDDVLGDAGDRGLRGHLRAALAGRVTTGFVKLGGGVAVALVLAGAIDGDRPARVLLDGALIALAANMGNLLDRAPGRTAKYALLAYVPLAFAAGTSAAGLALAVVVGATLAMATGDLRERFMLGDTGANAIGAALGTAAVLVGSITVRAVTVGVLLALTLTSELVSFSRVIERVPPLRAFDQLGRRQTEVGE